MEFIAKIPDNLPEIIENNGEEVKAWLAEVMQKYDGLVVTPESIRSAKDDKAKLNKLRTALEERRKEVKRDYLAPYMAFEEKYKELLALIDKPISSIDMQIKALDEQEQNEKYTRLKAYFDDCMASSLNVPVNVIFDRILNPKWKNKTMKEDALRQEIYDTLCRIKAEVDELNSYYTGSPHYTAIMDCYMQGYDKACALAYAAALIQQEQRQRAAQQAHREPEPTPPPVYEPTPEPPVQEPVQAQNEPKITGTFRVTGTKQQIIALRDFLRANQIAFEIVKEK
ncbi:MAG: DUF1351 domain-containing protein [Oscillospiraceae bacterium]|nr:DUF1351 domain-containing protein [Oscillospiraceae bacterium]